MSITMMLIRWLISQLAAGTHAALVMTTQPKKHQRATVARYPLQWRTPWLRSQLLSLLVTTLLAPTFWGIGILLVIDARNDQPFFWPSAMAIVALVNFFAIVCINQRQHRRPFVSRAGLALFYTGVCLPAASALLLLSGWMTGALADFSGQNAMIPLAIAGCYAIVSFAHAGLAHAWLAFD